MSVDRIWSCLIIGLVSVWALIKPIPVWTEPVRLRKVVPGVSLRHGLIDEVHAEAGFMCLLENVFVLNNSIHRVTTGRQDSRGVLFFAWRGVIAIEPFGDFFRMVGVCNGASSQAIVMSIADEGLVRLANIRRAKLVLIHFNIGIKLNGKRRGLANVHIFEGCAVNRIGWIAPLNRLLLQNDRDVWPQFRPSVLDGCLQRHAGSFSEFLGRPRLNQRLRSLLSRQSPLHH